MTNKQKAQALRIAGLKGKIANPDEAYQLLSEYWQIDDQDEFPGIMFSPDGDRYHAAEDRFTTWDDAKVSCGYELEPLAV